MAARTVTTKARWQGESRMLAPILPVQTVIFQILFLLIAIALEGFILHRNLLLSRKSSIEYAISINLLYTIVGWLIFFFIQPLLSATLRLQLISYVFFNSFHKTQLPSLDATILCIGIISFFVAFIVKMLGLYFLEWLLTFPQKNTKNHYQKTIRMRIKSRKSSKKITYNQNTSKATVILVANALSHSVLLGLLLLRSFQIK
jgi:hypothetical protein